MFTSTAYPPSDMFGQHHATLAPFADAASGSYMPTILADGMIKGNPVVFINDAFLALTGRARETILDRPLLDLFGDTADLYTLALFQATIANHRNGLWQMKLARENDTTFLGVVYLSPITDETNKIIAHSVNIFDLASLICISKDRESIFPGIYDKAPGFIAISSGKDHTFEYANTSYKNFVGRADLIGRTVADALPEIVDQKIIAILDEVYRTGIPFCASDLPISIWHPGLQRTEQRWIDVLYQHVRDQEGAIIGLFCEGHDVTDLHEANETIAALQMKMIHVSRVNAMGTMAAMLAHELNQPLTAISNYLGGTRSVGGRESDFSRLNMALDGIKEASERAAGIVNHLRQLTKHQKPGQEPFNLREAVDECIRLVRSSCRAEIEFDNQVASDMIMTADRVKIQQVLINLLKNGGEALAESEHALVIVSAVRDEHNLTVSVTDTGTGIPMEVAATMFSWTESTKDDGMGIGLSICRTIVELYRGSIWLERTGPNGTEFRFSLPLPAGSESEGPRPASAL